MKKNYKAALLRAQTGASPQSTCPTCPNYVNPEDEYTSSGTNAGHKSGWSDNSIPCRGKQCPEFYLLDPNSCACVEITTQPIFKRGGQYTPNMNKALKSFKNGGSTKK